MKKITYLAFLSIFIFAVTSCKKSDGDGPEEQEEEQQTSEYYITYKANGTLVTQTQVEALRGTSGSLKTLTIIGSEKDGANPKFKFFAEESFIGFVPGLSMTSSNQSADVHYVEYTNSAGVLHSTTLQQDGLMWGILEISYIKGGNVKGVFSGSIKAANGSTVEITEGRYNVKFSN